MAEQNRPASNEQAPDPSNNYERSHPEREAGMGRLDTNANATPRKAPDHINEAVPNAMDGSKEIAAHEGGNPTKAAPVQPDHSMLDEEPLGWDQTPQDAGGAAKRHPEPAVRAARRTSGTIRSRAEVPCCKSEAPAGS